MKIEIEYCVMWNYEPQALRAREQMLKLGSHDVTLVEGGSGVFEISIDGRLAFSKKSCGRFPQPDDIDSLLR